MTRRARIAVIGAGWWSGSVHLPALVANPDAELVAVCDVSLGRARDAAALFGVPHAVGDAAELVDMELDGVVVATPHNEHYRPARTMLAAGVDTLLEKPMTVDPREAWDLVATARTSGANLHVGYPYLYSPQVAVAKNAVAGGELGAVVMASALFASGVRQFFAGNMEAQRSATSPFVSQPTTYASRAAGGGQLTTQVTHAMAVTLWCTGLVPAQVSAFSSNLGLDVDVADVLAVRTTAGSLIGVSSTGSVHDGNLRSENYSFYCTDGHVKLDTARASLSIARRGASVEHAADITYGESNPLSRTSAALVDTALGRAPVVVPGEVGALTVSVLAAAAESARTGSLAAPWLPAQTEHEAAS